MTLFEGTYRLKRDPGGYGHESPPWRCTVVFDGLKVDAVSWSRRRAFRKAHRAMVKAVRLRNAVRSVDGLCAGNVYGARTDCCDAVIITRSDKIRPYCARCEKEF